MVILVPSSLHTEVSKVPVAKSILEEVSKDTVNIGNSICHREAPKGSVAEGSHRFHYYSLPVMSNHSFFS